MLITVAWRNIWRSKTRTLVVVGATVVGIWALIFLLGFFQGQIGNYIHNVIQNETSHIQIHNPEFRKDFETKAFIPEAESKRMSLASDPLVSAVAPRVILSGMLASSNGAQGVRVRGIDSEMEQQVTGFHDKLTQGAMMDPSRKNQMIISERMASILKVKLRSKVVLTFQTADGHISNAAFRIAGLYRSNKKMNDELFVYAQIQDLRSLAEMPPHAAHELALVLHDFDGVEEAALRMKVDYPEEQVETYRELSPDLDVMKTQIKISMTLMTVIFMLALIFGIINTMLMSVLERTRELGMLMAVGMNKLKVFIMVCLETLMLSLIGSPIGMLLGFLTIKYLHYRGISLARWSTALEEFGMSDLVRPILPFQNYLWIALAVIITGFLASIYPSWKAIKLRPVDALRKI
ncbi:MAG: FtsX-like permease family protein [Saprospiraceae bacterium]|nr:FtsX-like permease family protein [Saprospiraceae bacterium]